MMPNPENAEVVVTDVLDEGHIAQTNVESDIGSHTHILSFVEEEGEEVTQNGQKNLILDNEDEDDLFFPSGTSVLEKKKIREAHRAK